MSLADEKEPIRICWWGIPGTSKTTNLTDLAKLGRMYVVDADGGMKRRALEDFGIITENIEPYREVTFPALDGLYWDIRAEIDDDPEHCVGFGVDTATELGQRLLSIIVDQKQGAKIAKAEAMGQDSDDIDPFFRDRDYYGTLTEQVRRLLRGWKDLGIHLGITAHVRRDVDENTGKVMYGPDVNPAIQSLILGGVDVIARCRADGYWPEDCAGGKKDMDVMVADMRAGNDFHAKDRFHKTPRIMVNPTFTRIIDYIEGTLTLDNDEEQKAYRELWSARKAEAKRTADERAARKAAAKKTTPAKKTAAAKTTAVKPDEEDDSATEE